jgi:hypothetical protein
MKLPVATMGQIDSGINSLLTFPFLICAKFETMEGLVY